MDPEALDDAEDRFAASLDSFVPPPPRYNRIVMPEVSEPMDEPQLISAVRDEFTLAPQELPPPGDGRWRDEVADRVQTYRAKRRGGRRIGGAFSMDLDFEARPAPPEPPPYVAPAVEYSAGAVATEPTTTVRWDGLVEEPEPAPAEFVVEEPAAPALPDVWNIIPFPASTDEVPRGDELAEPVIQTPRILEAPEFVEQAIPTPMAEIALEEEPPELPVDVELPLQVVPLPQRVVGGIADLTIVLGATAMFVALAVRISGTMPMSKAVLAVGFVVPCLFWIVYQYLFLVYSGRTPGMLVARLRLADFEGAPVGRRLRRWRALALALSSVSLGLGFVWAIVDEDTLCWHDRITKTYPVEAGNR